MSKIDSYIVFDFETGGLKHSLSPATEIGMLTLHPDSLQETSRYTDYIKSEITLVEDSFKPELIPENVYKGGYYFKGALAVTGITMDTIKKQGVDVVKVVERMADEFSKGKLSKGHWSKPILVGHNLAFDIPILQVMFKIAKIDLTKLIQGFTDHQGNWIPIFKDTMYMSKEMWANSENYKLGHCCSLSGAEVVDAHRAMNDVVATADLFCFFLNNMRNNKGVSLEKKEIIKARKTFQM